MNLLTNQKSLEIALCCLQCLEASTCPINDDKDIEIDERLNQQFEICFQVFQDYLINHDPNVYSLENLKIIIISLHGLQNIIVQKQHILEENLGIILSIIKTYMLYNIKDIEFMKPQKLRSSTLSIPEPSTTNIREKRGGKVNLYHNVLKKYLRLIAGNKMQKTANKSG